MITVHVNPATYDSSVQEFDAGGLFWRKGVAYRYVQIEDLDVADGDVLEFSNATGYEVTKDRSGGSSLGRRVAGVAVGTITDGNWGFIQVSGVHSNMKTDGGVSALQRLIPHATADGQADSEVVDVTSTVNEATVEAVVDSGRVVFAVALADDDASSPSRVVAQLMGLI